MENTIILDSGQKIEVLFQDEVSLDIDCSLRYIESGKKEIDQYVEENIKSELERTIVDAKANMQEQIALGVENAAFSATKAAQETIDTTIGTIKDDLQSYADNEIKTELLALVDVSNTNVLTSTQNAASCTAANESATASAASAIEAAQSAQSLKTDVEDLISKSNLDVGDIGFAPLGIDETQNKRRYLNGQVISQAQFVSFTNKVKAAVQLTPSLAASETNWQAEVTNSKLGQCGKFVIDDALGTIRLPKVVNIQGLQDLALMGSIKAESLPNITGSFTPRETAGYASGGERTGAFYVEDKFVGNYVSGASGSGYKMKFDASRSSSAYQDNAPVQQEAIQYPYFIQVAKGSEDSVDITREIELNNPFFLGMSQYFESEPKNASWLISNGAFHSGATYSSFYEWLLKIYNGSETVSGVSVKASTDTYDDFDYVVNTTDTTFRLPIYDGSENLPGDKFIDLTLNESGSIYTAPANGFVYVYRTGLSDGNTTYIASENRLGSKSSAVTGSLITQNFLPVRKGRSFSVTYSGATTSFTLRFTYAKGNGSLYFYVGETVQDANVICASQVLTRVADLSDRYISGLGMPSDKYIDLELGATGTTYTAPCRWIARLRLIF